MFRVMIASVAAYTSISSLTFVFRERVVLRARRASATPRPDRLRGAKPVSLGGFRPSGPFGQSPHPAEPDVCTAGLESGACATPVRQHTLTHRDCLNARCAPGHASNSAQTRTGRRRHALRAQRDNVPPRVYGLGTYAIGMPPVSQVRQQCAMVLATQAGTTQILIDIGFRHDAPNWLLVSSRGDLKRMEMPSCAERKVFVPSSRA
eukprot:7102976-Prymnesium_polylepis.1